MPEAASLTDKRMRLRYAGTCRLCGIELEARTDAIYERALKTVRCVTCLPSPDADPGTRLADEVQTHPHEPHRAAGEAGTVPRRALDDWPQAQHQTERPPVAEAPEPSPHQEGAASLRALPHPEPVTHDAPAAPAADLGSVAGASARREYERRKARDEQRVRDEWGRLAPVALFLRDEKQSTKAWATGAVGEEKLGKALDARSGPNFRTLHDRLIPGSRANIDHLVITPSGIWVIDAKRYKGRPELRVEGGLLRPVTRTLVVGRRDATKLLAGMHKQLAVVREVVGEQVPVRGVLCFIDADWPLIGGSILVDGIHVLWPKAVFKLIGRTPSAGLDIDAAHVLLASTFRPA